MQRFGRYWGTSGQYADIVNRSLMTLFDRCHFRLAATQLKLQRRRQRSEGDKTDGAMWLYWYCTNV
jgi:hypothetical protein